MQQSLAVLTLLLCLFFPAQLMAEESEPVQADSQTGATAAKVVAEPESSLRANFKRIALDISSVSVSNAEQYQDSPIAALKADDQTMLKGVFDFVLEYEKPKFRWDNSLYLGYGKTTIKPVEGDRTSSENEDMILATTDLSYKLWKLRGMDLGPFGNLAYQTEFTSNDDAPLNKIFRGKTGIKLFNGKYFSNLYAAMGGEYDITYSDSKNSKLAWEVGGSVKYPLREGVDFQAEGYFRDYLTYSEYVGTDLKYDLNLTGRMNVMLINKFSLSPFISYRLAQSREARDYADNFQIGLSLTYSNLHNIW